MKQFIYHPLRYLINYILPTKCLLCLEFIEDNNAVCGKCFNNFKFITEPYCKICGTPFPFSMKERYECGSCIRNAPFYDVARALVVFDDFSRQMLHKFKYNDQTNYANFYAKLLYQRYKDELDNIEYITSVPMHKFKRILRQYNHAHLLAVELAKLINKPVIYDLLRKTKFTKSQTGLNKPQRQKNLLGSIEISKKHNIKDKKILLIDDIRTTGATANLCSKILKAGGANKVALITVAMTCR